MPRYVRWRVPRSVILSGARDAVWAVVRARSDRPGAADRARTSSGVGCVLDFICAGEMAFVGWIASVIAATRCQGCSPAGYRKPELSERGESRGTPGRPTGRSAESGLRAGAISWSITPPSARPGQVSGCVSDTGDALRFAVCDSGGGQRARLLAARRPHLIARSIAAAPSAVISPDAASYQQVSQPEPCRDTVGRAPRRRGQGPLCGSRLPGERGDMSSNAAQLFIAAYESTTGPRRSEGLPRHAP